MQVQEQLSETAEKLVEKWINDFCLAYQLKAKEQALKLEFSPQVAQETLRYARACYRYWSGMTKERAKTETLHPLYKTLAEQKAREQWTADQINLRSLPKLLQKKVLAPVAIDRMNPKTLVFRHNYLLNHYPNEYFGKQVEMRAPVIWNCSRFVDQHLPGWGLGQFTDKLRVLTDGRVFIRFKTKVWCLMFGVQVHLSDNPNLRIINKVLPQETRDISIIEFLEKI